jgi:hypothetical protein
MDAEGSRTRARPLIGEEFSPPQLKRSEGRREPNFRAFSSTCPDSHSGNSKIGLTMFLLCSTFVRCMPFTPCAANGMRSRRRLPLMKPRSPMRGRISPRSIRRRGCSIREPKATSLRSVANSDGIERQQTPAAEVLEPMRHLALPVARSSASDDEDAGPATSVGVPEVQFMEEVVYSATREREQIPEEFFYLNWP